MSGQKTKTLLVLTGPTASGKTGLAIRLAQLLGTSIISADSRQCYLGMTIGTAQPNADELAAAKHYFVDCFPVTEPQSAADFERLALGYLDKIFAQSDVAVVCGGTGLYIKALCEGLDEMPSVDPAISAEIEAGYAQQGLEWLQARMHEEDPTFRGHAEWSNPARLLRALSFVRSTGKSILEFRSNKPKERPFRTNRLAIDFPRELLYKRINLRVDEMMKSGLLDEVKAMEPYRNLSPLQTVGYSELFEYFDGNCSLDFAVEKIKQHTRNYAKRQVTWLRREPDVKWINGLEADAEKILGDLELIKL
jgi:tRNA dimethylallyltransferase